jgi:hypothetical protein
MKTLLLCALGCSLIFPGLLRVQATEPPKKLTCCQEAKTKGKECAHKCCITAHKKGESCTRCNPNKEDVDRKAQKGSKKAAP